MIYLIYQNSDLIVETDNLDFVKRVIRKRPNCAIKELASGKVYRPRIMKKEAAVVAPTV